MRLNTKAETKLDKKRDSNVRLPGSLWDDLRAVAKHRAKENPDLKESVNATIEVGLRTYVDAYRKQHGL